MSRHVLTLAAVFALSGALCAAEESHNANPDTKQEHKKEHKTDHKSEATNISLAELKKALDSKSVTLLDCNGSGSFAKSHIPGAVDFETVKKDLASHLPKDKGALVVSYCGGPKCKAYKDGVKAAEALGYTNVKHFSEGLSGWQKAHAGH